MYPSLILQASKFNSIKAPRFGPAGLTSTSSPDASTRVRGRGQLITNLSASKGRVQLITNSAASVGGGQPIPSSPASIGPRRRANPVIKVKSFPHILSFLKALFTLITHFSPKDPINTEKIYGRGRARYYRQRQVRVALHGHPSEGSTVSSESIVRDARLYWSPNVVIYDSNGRKTALRQTMMRRPYPFVGLSLWCTFLKSFLLLWTLDIRCFYQKCPIRCVKGETSYTSCRPTAWKSKQMDN